MWADARKGSGYFGVALTLLRARLRRWLRPRIAATPENSKK
jgi:hypothetical protein